MISVLPIAIPSDLSINSSLPQTDPESLHQRSRPLAPRQCSQGRCRGLLQIRGPLSLIILPPPFSFPNKPWGIYPGSPRYGRGRGPGPPSKIGPPTFMLSMKTSPGRGRGSRPPLIKPRPSSPRICPGARYQVGKRARDTPEEKALCPGPRTPSAPLLPPRGPQVRGAPAIAISALLGLAAEAYHHPGQRNRIDVSVVLDFFWLRFRGWTILTGTFF